MKIEISSGIGTGPTKLAAFDSALIDSGVANYNLIKLSSVIPPGSQLVEVEETHPIGAWGDRLYVVMAEKRVDTPNEEAWAGVGWVQEKGTGRGLFVEHDGNSQASVKRDIRDSLRALMNSRGVKFGPIQMQITGTVCHTEPVCALVVAVYGPEGWPQG